MDPDQQTARAQAAWLARNAVDCLPEGGLEHKLVAGPSAAGEARDRPDRAGHPPRVHGRAPEAARVPGPGPHGGADRRRLHRARGRSQRPLEHPPGARSGPDRRQRPDLPGAGLQGPALRPARGPLQRRVAGHVDGGAVPAAAHDHGRAAARARRLRQAVRGQRADLGARAALPAAAGHRLGRGPRRRRARGDRPEVQPAAGPRHPARLRQARAGDPDDAAADRAPTASARCPSRWATTSGSPSRRRRCTARR